MPSAVLVDDEFDLDIDSVVTLDIEDSTMITSVSLCTPGCTSPGTGSGCSYCC